MPSTVAPVAPRMARVSDRQARARWGVLRRIVSMPDGISTATAAPAPRRRVLLDAPAARAGCRARCHAGRATARRASLALPNSWASAIVEEPRDPRDQIVHLACGNFTARRKLLKGGRQLSTTTYSRCHAFA